jgi:TolA-binding protein
VRSDLFSLGIVLYEMATGLRPFNGSSRREVHDAIVTRDPPPPSSLNVRLPVDLDRIIIKALEKNRSFRFQSASDLRTDLLRLKRDLEGAVPRPAAVPRGSKTSGRWPAAALLSIVIFAAAIFALKESERQIATIPSTPIGPRSLATPHLGAAIRPPVKPKDRAARPAPAVTPAVAPAREPSAAQELRIARVKADAGLHAQALATLRDLVAKYTGSKEAVDAYFLIARIHERQEQPEDALATYLEIASRYEHHPRAPEAMFRFAETTLRSPRRNKAVEARRMLTEAADRYPASDWAARSLLEKGQLEDREQYVEQDARMNATVPSALVTYRRLVETYPHSPSTERALAHLGEIYQRLKRFDLAVDTFVRLASGYPRSPHDAWFRAGEIYRRQLRDTDRARDAYARVPVSSPHFADAQKHLK